jgi:PAS domain S-box-containing protein
VVAHGYHCFTSSEVNFVRTVAQNSCGAIQNAGTYRQITMLFNQLEENESFLTNILDSIRAQLVVVDPEERIVMANRLFLEAVGREEQDVLGTDYVNLFTAAYGEQAEYLAARVLQEGTLLDQIYQAEGEGGQHWFERTALPLFNDQGALQFVLEMVHDVSLRHQLQEEQVKRVKLEGVMEMAGTVAHEINTPLFAALGTAQLLQDDLTEEEQVRELATIIRNLRGIGELTGRMVELTGFESRNYVGTTKIVGLSDTDAR